MAKLTISGDTSGSISIAAPAVAGSRTITFPSVTANLLGNVTVSQGGTGLTSATAYGVIHGGTTSTGAFQSVAGLGTSGQILTSTGAGSLPTFQNKPANVSVTIDTTAGTGKTFTIPTIGTYAYVRMWGGGGSGGRGGATAARAGGGGGGAYVEGYYLLSDLGVVGATVSYNVAAGGAAVSAAGNGNPGGNTTFAYDTSYVFSAYGGGAGVGNASSTNGGGGGGVLGVGLTTAGGSMGGGASATIPGNIWGGSGGGSSSSTTLPGANSFLGGAGGGGANTSAGSGGTAFGGGGNGGAGSISSGTAGVAGTQPGGGGGAQGANGGSSGKGGDGRVEIWVW